MSVPLAGWRGEDESGGGRGAPNPEQLDRYIENGGFWMEHVPEEALYFKPWNQAYQDWAVEKAFFDKPQPYVFSLYVETMARFQQAARGHGERQPPEHLRARILETLDPLPCWWEPLEEQAGEPQGFSAARHHPAPGGHVPLLGSQNAWLRQIHGHNPLYVPTAVWKAQGFCRGRLGAGDLAHGAITVPVARMDALNPHTVWTWNAIGKRKGAWALDPDAPEAKKGFCSTT